MKGLRKYCNEYVVRYEYVIRKKIAPDLYASPTYMGGTSALVPAVPKHKLFISSAYLLANSFL